MNSADFCIKHRVTTILIFVILAIFGIMGFANLKLTLLPSMEYPAAYITCYYSGATPETIEQLVTKPLESAIATISGVKSIDSTASDGFTTISITYEDDTDVDIAATKLREKFDALNLPDGCNDPIIMNININDLMPVEVVALAGADLSDLQSLADDTVSPALERIEGVASVEITGGVNTIIAVDVDQTRASGYNLSLSYISNCLAAANVLYPGGDVQNGTQTLTVSTDGKLKSLDDVKNLLITLPAGGTVRLSEIADVHYDQEETDSVANVNNGSCVMLSISKSSGANEVETAKNVNAALAELATKDSAVNYTVVYDSSQYINRTANNAMRNIIQGVILAALVAFLFLRRFGATLAIAISMPFCILTTFVMMRTADLTLNMMSLGGIAMGVGMIVDNSIVVLENIYRFAANGYSRLEASVEGTKEVVSAVVASTLTTVAVFIPVGLSGGMAGMMFKDFSLTIAFLLLASLFIALTLVPLMCYFLLDENTVRQKRLEDAQNKKPSTLSALLGHAEKQYIRLLNFFIRKRWVGVLTSVVLVVIFSLTCMNSKMVLIPEMDQGMVQINVSLPIGSELSQTEAIVDKIGGIVQDNCPELDYSYSIIQEESAQVMLNLLPLAERDRSSKQVADDLRSRFDDIAGCEISIESAGMSGTMGSGSNIDVQITGTDYEVLTAISNDLEEQIANLEDAINVTSSASENVPQVSVTLKRENASRYGLTAATIGAAIRAELTGATATTITIDNKDIDLVVRGSGLAKTNLDALRSLQLPAATGGYIPLSSVADVTVVQAPQSISRTDQTRMIEITGDTVSGNSAAMTSQINQIIANYQIPQGYAVTAGGTSDDISENMTSLLEALVVAMGLVYFILASQFESFIMPVIIMMILPIAFTGALFGLPLMGKDMSMISVVGLIMLAGTVVNASIILVSYINMRREKGESMNEAILNACPLRIRPIMMTTLTTVLAMLPMTFSTSEGSEMMSEMGIVMICGMLISTVITLLFTPVYYSLLSGCTRRVKRKFGRHDAETPVEAE